MNEREQRQLDGIINQINAFESHQIRLTGLISSLEALLNAMEDVPQAWRSEFRRQWGVLEQVYAVAADEGRFPTAAAEETVIAEAVGRLRELVQVLLAADDS